MDILSFTLANAISGISVRQGMIVTSLATLKTISDHCNFVFPWDPFGYINGNNAAFHDLHHQSWGLKVSEISGPKTTMFLEILTRVYLV